MGGGGYRLYPDFFPTIGERGARERKIEKDFFFFFPHPHPAALAINISRPEVLHTLARLRVSKEKKLRVCEQARGYTIPLTTGKHYPVV